jgi:hypothetical protein
MKGRRKRMNTIPETDQWLLTGECNKCRRLSYCKKKCGAYKREWKKCLKEAVAAVLKDKTNET